ncbi:hypothetical protein BDV25DRAFT_138078 [Aspergillus avenaceus]|uniref:Uncharacterized protein n=1 Tax=Aspergillus avenaceus TaxID=36643 RepID=A0A5N6U0W8_ASPAV|nr:hypothetical protein BDV25DRAFT_138078 [Aspergillus avenaceus]
MAATLPTGLTREQRTVLTRLRKLSECEDIISIEKCKKIGIEVIPLGLQGRPNPTDSPFFGNFFEPLTEKFMEENPINTIGLEKRLKNYPRMLTFREYDAEAAAAATEAAAVGARSGVFVRNEWETHVCLEGISHIFYNHIFSLPRKTTFGDYGPIIVVCNWDWIEDDSPLNVVMGLGRGFTEDVGRIKMLLEVTGMVLPHVIMVMQYITPDVVGNDTLRRYELAYLLNAMKLRLENGYFGKAQPQPVLMVSFTAPQHGRILQAYIHNHTRIVVSCSQLYSFEKNETAPFELFARWFLARPVGMEAKEPKVGD